MSEQCISCGTLNCTLALAEGMLCRLYTKAQLPTSSPSEPGWYWYKGTKHFSDWNIIEFKNINNELLSIPSHLPIKYFEGQLIGPIKEPT